MARADGSIIIDTKIDTKGMSTGAANIESQFRRIGKAVKSLGIAVGGVFAVRKLVQFGKEAIKLGSDLQEVQNVVDVTFTTMDEQINAFAKNAKYTAGLSETMAKQYAGTFGAMAKSFKFSEQEAYTMATTLTQLSGDVASFYNISQDLAAVKLKSVFSGETETLKDLGIVMTQAALSEFALSHGINKTVESMTEQEKVALRYRFILEQLGAASGDFARTQGGWANQTRLLALQFDELKATIGQGLINALTPVLRVINALLGRLQTLASAFKSLTTALFGEAGGGAAGVAKGYEAAAQGAEDLAGGIADVGGAAKKAKRDLAGFDEITKLSDQSAGGGKGGKGAGGGSFDFGIGGINPQQQTVIEQQTQQMVDHIMQFLEPLKNIDFSNLQNSLSNLFSTFDGLGAEISESLGWVWFNILVPLSKWTIEEFAPEGINLLAEAFQFMGSILSPVIDGFKALMEYLQPVFDFLGDVAVEILKMISDLFKKLADTISSRSEKISGIFSNLGELFNHVWVDMIDPILRTMVDVFKWAFNLAGDIAASAIGGIIDVLAGLIEFLTGFFMGDWGKAWDGIKNIFKGVFDFLKNVLNDILRAFGTTFEEVASKVSSCFTKIKNNIKNAVNGIIGAINGMIRGVVDGINIVTASINNLSFDIPDWVPIWGGNSFGFRIPQISAPQIPYLAKGAVIPPNAPFMAMLGDQRNGTNIEAPLKTIQEAVAAVMEDFIGGTMAGFEATVAILREILEAVLGIEISDEVIGNAVKRYNQKENIMRGV